MGFNLSGNGIGPAWTSCVNVPSFNNAAAQTVDVNLNDWELFTDVDGTLSLRIEISHNLGSQNLWFVGVDENGSSWTTKNFEYITDNSFYLLVKEVSQRFFGKLHIYSTDVKKADPDVTPAIEAFVETFSISKWIETAPDSGIYTATFVHGLMTDVIEYTFYTDSDCPYLLCADSKSATQLIVRTTTDGRRGGRVFIERVV